MRRLLVGAGLALAGVAAGLAGAQPGEDEFSGTVVLEPDRIFHPLPLELRRGEALAYDWAVEDPPAAEIYFSFHLHIGPQLVNLSEEVASEAKGKKLAERDGAYSFLWHNRGNDTLSLSYRYFRQGREEAPTPLAWWLAPTALASAAWAVRRAHG